MPLKSVGLSFVTALSLSVGLAGAQARAGGLPLQTTPQDFFAPGTQPGGTQSSVLSFSACAVCHAEYDLNHEPGRWRGSMHAFAARDPLFRAAVAIANQDAEGAGETCFRCHAPRGWVQGRIEGAPDGSNLFLSDVNEGIGCNFCHRMVDPVYEAGVSPDADADIIAALTNAPTQFGNAQYIVDPFDVRRGPLNYPPEIPGFEGFEPPHEWAHSPFHRTGDMCGTCHDVSNPVLSRTGQHEYVLNANDAAHPTGSKFDQFPEQRTYSEWTASAYSQGSGVPTMNPNDPYDLNGRFGGGVAAVKACQDCHMPRVAGNACNPFNGPPDRPDIPYHSFQGANRWMLDVIEYLFAEELDFETIDAMQLAKTDTEYMLGQATDMELTQMGAELSVRVVNQCGHKLLTGYPEGRRIWINVQFLDGSSALIAERGAYDAGTAELTTGNTKVYETKHGLDSYMAGQTGLAAGPTFHLVLNNKIYKDNRIPPRGFTNAGYAAVQSEPVGASYADGQHWDDTRFAVPSGAAQTRVRLYYQTASKEYIEFLDETYDTLEGDIIADAWENTGKSPPFAMDDESLGLAPFFLGDVNADGVVDFDDLNLVLGNFGRNDVTTITQGDADVDGDSDFDDLNLVLGNFGSGG